MRFGLIVALCGLFAASTALAAPVTLAEGRWADLSATSVGAKQTLPLFPVGAGRNGPVEFERIDVYAADAKVIAVDNGVQRELPRSTRVHLLGSGSDGTRIALSFDPDHRQPPSGVVSSRDGEFVLLFERAGKGWSVRAVEPAAALPAGLTPKFLPNNDALPNPNGQSSPLEGLELSAGIAPLATPAARLAVVAVDTDSSFMSERFSNNTANATAWIADLFAQMNVIYRRDLDVVLLQGTTFLRTVTDPYTNTDTVATQAALVEFGNYWSANYTTGPNAVSRSFAMLLSGNSAAGNSGSGIAWLNSYCQSAGNGGSYSVNQVLTDPGFPVSPNTFLVAHELGHNFGAHHTHCSNSTTGANPVATGTIDQCFNGEAGLGCYGGPVSCPAGGTGTLMSYCHTGAPTGASCGSNQLLFAPAHITFVRARVAANTPSCLRSETIFASGFDS